VLANVILAVSKTSTPAKSNGEFEFFIIIIALVAFFWFVMIRPQRNRQRRIVDQQNNVAPGARVRTTAGMYATVVEVDGDDVILEVAPGVETRYVKRAIMEVLPDPEAEAAYDGDGESEDYAADDEVPDDESAPRDEDTGDAGDLPGVHIVDEAPAHLGDECPNGSTAAAEDSRTPGSV
jgi:preprotein translocase subunit YajC